MHLSANETVKISKSPNILPWDWLAAGLLLATLVFSSARLAATQWTEHLLGIQLLALLACLAGLALGRSLFPRWLAALYGFAFATFFIPWQLGLTITEATNWSERLRILAGKLGLAVGQVLRAENASEPILFLVFIALLFWAFGLYAGHRLTRYADPWGACLPFCALAIVFQTFDYQFPLRAWYLAATLLFTLLLVARVQLVKQKAQWERSHVQMSEGVGAELQRAAVGAVLLLVFFAWVTPALASSLDSAESFWNTVTTPWRQLRAEFERAFYPLEGTRLTSGDYYGETMRLGRGNSLSTSTVFTVQEIEPQGSALRYYWRDRVYDYYENGQWQITFNETEALNENLPPSAELEGRLLTRFLFTVARPTQLLHAAPQPLWVNLAANADFATNPDGSTDIAALQAIHALEPGQSYEALSALSVASQEELRAAGTEYPAWIKERYLQVPAEISERTRELAFELAQGQETPYDRATEITNYLRQNIEYVETIPLAPFDVEPIEWVLFEQKQGFCNYYASAEVMLLRILSIPARLAVGYAAGEREKNSSGGLQFAVRQLDAHAWPEVYFPSIGWVEFEPTANQDALVRPEVTTAELDPIELGIEHPLDQEGDLGLFPPRQDELAQETDTNNIDGSVNTWQQPLVQITLLSSFAVLGSILLWKRYRSRGGETMPALLAHGFERFEMRPPRPIARWAKMADLPRLSRAYMEINTALNRLGQTPKPGDTPAQRAAALGKALPQLNEELLALGRNYQAQLYSLVFSKNEDDPRRTIWRMRVASMRIALRRGVTVALNALRR